MKKFAIITIVILAVAALGYWIFKPGNKNNISYKTTQVKKGSIQDVVTATGTIEPITQVEVGTQVSGTISRIYVDFNSTVKKGELIAELDRTVLESELASQTATLESNRNEYEYQQKNYKRISGLHAKQLVSDTEYETALYQLDKARAAYQKSQSDLIKTRTNLSYATIYSPIDGVVLSRAVDEGQTVAASFNTPTLFTIANDLSKMQVIANVEETDIGQVKEGQRVTFWVNAFYNEIFEGSVTQIRLQPTTTSNVVTYEVVIDAPNPDLKLMPGMTANITIYTLYKENVLVVPKGAFNFQPLEAPENNPLSQKPGETTLWIKNENGISPVSVQQGSSDKINVEILNGLQEGDQVVTGIQLGKTVENGNNGNGGSSPFMPQRPGGGRRN